MNTTINVLYGHSAQSDYTSGRWSQSPAAVVGHIGPRPLLYDPAFLLARSPRNPARVRHNEQVVV